MGGPSHVAILCPGLGGGGGVANVALRHARELAPDHTVTLVSDGFPQGLPQTLRQLSVHSSRFRFLRRYAHVPAALREAGAMRTALERLHARRAVDLVICHGHVAGVFAARPFGIRNRVPWLLVVHGDVTLRPPGTYHWSLERLYRWCTPVASRAATRVVSVTPTLTQVVAGYGVPRGRVLVLENGFDLEELGGDPGALSADGERVSGPLQVLFMGRLDPEKDPATLVTACARATVAGTLLDLHVVGSGRLEKDLRQQAAALGIASRVHFHGWVPRDGLCEHLRNAHAVCLPSRADSWPLAAVEALGSGRPLLASRIDGLAELVRQGVNGYLFEPGDATELAAHLRRFDESRHTWPTLSAAARESVAHLHWHRVGERLRALCAAVLAEVEEA